MNNIVLEHWFKTAVNQNIGMLDSDAKAGEFTTRLLSLMKTGMRRYLGRGPAAKVEYLLLIGEDVELTKGVLQSNINVIQNPLLNVDSEFLSAYKDLENNRVRDRKQFCLLISNQGKVILGHF